MDDLNQAPASESQSDLASLVDIGNESLDAVAAQQEDVTPEPQEAAPEAQPSYVEPPVEPAANEPEAHTSFSALDDALSDIEELEHDGFYDKIDASHLKDLPPVARRILHNFRVDRKQQEDRHQSKIQSLMTKIEERERQLASSERDFAKRQSEFASLVDDPEVQKLLTEPEGELPDVFTEQGVEARIQRGIAKGMQAILEPMKAAADVKARENTYLEFLDKHPEMRDPGCKKEVVGLVRSRGNSGMPITTQDAYQLTKARRTLAERQARATQEQRARQQSARRVGRAVSGGNPSNGEIPPEVMKQGAPAIVQWLKANPEAHRKLSQSFR